MRTVEEQLALVTAAAVAPRPVRVAISEAQGLLCAEEVVAAVVLSRRVFADFDLDEVAGSCRAGSADASGGARGADTVACNGIATEQGAAGSNAADANESGE